MITPNSIAHERHHPVSLIFIILVGTRLNEARFLLELTSCNSLYTDIVHLLGLRLREQQLLMATRQEAQEASSNG